MKNMSYEIVHYNSGPPMFKMRLKNITVHVGERATYIFPSYEDPDGDEMDTPLILGAIPSFVTTIFPKLIIKPSLDFHIGEYIIFVTFKDKHIMRPLPHE